MVYTTIWCRVSTFIERHLQLNLGFRSENSVFTGEGFSLNSGFRSILCSQEIDSVLIQFSQKNCVHQRILYRDMNNFSSTISSHLMLRLCGFKSLVCEMSTNNDNIFFIAGENKAWVLLLL